jgi:hypothetical protein
MCLCGHRHGAHELGGVCLTCRNEDRHRLEERAAFDKEVAADPRAHMGERGMCSGFAELEDFHG